MGCKKIKRKKTLGRATVRLVSRGEEHPYVIEVTTPGWQGCNEALRERIKLPDDLKEISDLLDQAKVRRWGGSDGKTTMLFMNDGTTEIVLADSTDVEPATRALVRAGWLSPEMPLEAAIN
jgi:hypothetical protein